MRVHYVLVTEPSANISRRGPQVGWIRISSPFVVNPTVPPWNKASSRMSKRAAVETDYVFGGYTPYYTAPWEWASTLTGAAMVVILGDLTCR